MFTLFKIAIAGALRWLGSLADKLDPPPAEDPTGGGGTKPVIR